MARILSWILILLGLILIALKLIFKSISEKISFLAQLQILHAVIIGLALIAAGFILLKRGKIKRKGKHAEKEVPIYHGKKIIGYRRK